MSESGSVGCDGGDTGTLRVEAALSYDIGSSVDPDPDEIQILPKRRGVRNNIYLSTTILYASLCIFWCN